MDVYQYSLVHGIKLMFFFEFDIIQKATITSDFPEKIDFLIRNEDHFHSTTNNHNCDHY